LLALLLTLIAGAIMFVLLGKDPLDSLYALLVEPLLDPGRSMNWQKRRRR